MLYNSQNNFNDLDPSQITDGVSIPLNNFWVGDETAGLLDNSLPSRICVERNWDVWRIGSIFDGTNIYIYVDTQQQCTASLVSGIGDVHNNMVSIVNNNYYSVNRPFTLKILWNNVPNNQSVINCRIRVSDQNNNIIEKPITINIINRSISIACSSSTVSNNISEILNIFLKDNNSNEILDPVLSNWYLVSGSGDTHNSRFAISNNTRESACSIQLNDLSGLNNGDSLSIRVKCVLRYNDNYLGGSESDISFENTINFTVNSSIISNRLPYSNLTTPIVVPVDTFDLANIEYSIRYDSPRTFNYSSNLFHSSQIKVNNEEWKWIASYVVNNSSRIGTVIYLSTSTYQSAITVPSFFPSEPPIVISHCDQIRFRFIWSYDRPWPTTTNPNPIIGEWTYSPTYTLLPNFGRASSDCNSSVINLPVYNFFVSSQT